MSHLTSADTLCLRTLCSIETSRTRIMRRASSKRSSASRPSSCIRRSGVDQSPDRKLLHESAQKSKSRTRAKMGDYVIQCMFQGFKCLCCRLNCRCSVRTLNCGGIHARKHSMVLNYRDSPDVAVVLASDSTRSQLVTTFLKKRLENLKARSKPLERD